MSKIKKISKNSGKKVIKTGIKTKRFTNLRDGVYDESSDENIANENNNIETPISPKVCNSLFIIYYLHLYLFLFLFSLSFVCLLFVFSFYYV